MLDDTTKRNINAARDVLVGKVPDPKAQVEQITTALIYKFMDDLDKESVEMGGKAKFFTEDFEKYAWTKVLDTRLSGEARLDLYVQAITSMSRNPNLPQLFRDIFKDAFLPYRDPETLSLFLKEINKFTYSHSEELGNAFEYLLLILGSQGDAGQFRTPRHIIDFIVDVVDPKKTDSILDPACGTAGFLISAYKHIRKHNSSNYQPEKEEGDLVGKTASEVIVLEKETYTGDKLSPAERTRLAENIQGYDISPDMVRLSLVNLYLHGFTNPKIFEYDTLTSEKRWGETFDVILANPPFMTPKGGIRPHKRFQVQANRSEVLFVDYILEHLNQKGRAGIIVPEGVIFKSENAYKNLRKLLLEDGLFAVASLPPGVFNPYSGVKTSILFFDNEVAKQTDEILFIKIENDGFDLGAQRRKIDRNDLPEAQATLQAWKKGEKRNSELALWVKKDKIAESRDYSLIGERYSETEIRANQKWPMIELGEVCTFEYGKPLKKEDRKNGEYPVFGSNGIVGYHDEYLVEGPFIIVGRKGSAGAVVYSEVNGFPIDTTFYVQLFNKDNVELKFLYYILQRLGLEKVNTQAGVPGLNRNDAYKVKIPLPPLEVQREIVEQIEVKQAAIEAAKAVIKNLERERRYFGHELKKLDGVEWVSLGDVAKRITKGTTPTTIGFSYADSGIAFVKIESIDGLGNILTNKLAYIDEEGHKALGRSQLEEGDVLFSIAGALGRVAVVEKTILPANTNQALAIITPKHEILDSRYLALILGSNLIHKLIDGLKVGVAQYNLSLNQVSNFQIPLLSLEEQKLHVEQIRKEEEIISVNQKLIELMKNKIVSILDVIHES
ncbi:MAG: restriction endonuclease subunit M/S [Anaerolineae bacterium]|nr:MAG: restriction endonuclease subunit M/S [Anaerolineae bacterium]